MGEKKLFDMGQLENAISMYKGYSSRGKEWNMCADAMWHTLNFLPDIDPETLPIVQGLREKLARYEKAEEEGRLIELPCKIGDKVKVYANTWGNIWNYKAYYHNGKEYLIGEIIAVVKTKKQVLMKIRVEHNVSWKKPTKRYPVSALGKTVFLVERDTRS